MFLFKGGNDVHRISTPINWQEFFDIGIAGFCLFMTHIKEFIKWSFRVWTLCLCSADPSIGGATHLAGGDEDIPGTKIGKSLGFLRCEICLLANGIDVRGTDSSKDKLRV